MMRALLLVMLLVMGIALAAARPAHAYSVEPGDILVKPVAGAAVNVLRFSAATRATPQGGMVLGVDVDWMFDDAIAFCGALRPTLSPSFIDGNLGLGAKYRAVQLQAPFIPYGSAMATTALGGPLGNGDVHFNVGLRLAGGVDYFVMRNLAVGLEMGVELSHLFNPGPQPEASTEILAGVTWRL